MKRFKSNNIPLELFGHNTSCECPKDDHWSRLKKESSQNPYKEFPCPYSSGMCNKIRKASPNPLIGNCSVRFSKKNIGEYQDWIVCPKRFEQENIIFNDCLHLIRGNKEDINLASEISIKGVGNIDFGLVNQLPNGSLKDFLAIEVQGMGTSNSGSIWNARNDYLNAQLKENYNFSLNQKDASKKILIQLLHKGTQLSRWRSSLVLVTQDHFLEHLREQYNINAHFHEQNEQDFIHIHAYSYIQDDKGKYTLKLKEAISTDIFGLLMCLISNPEKKYLPYSILESRIKSRKKEGKLKKL